MTIVFICFSNELLVYLLIPFFWIPPHTGLMLTRPEFWKNGFWKTPTIIFSMNPKNTWPFAKKSFIFLIKQVMCDCMSHYFPSLYPNCIINWWCWERPLASKKNRKPTRIGHNLQTGPKTPWSPPQELAYRAHERPCLLVIYILFSRILENLSAN